MNVPGGDGVRGVTVLGATGSIGVSTLDVLARHPERFRIVALTANRQVDRLFEQCVRVRPDHAVMLDPQSAESLERKLREAGLPTRVDCGLTALRAVASAPATEIVMAAIVGAAGLLPTLDAVLAGKRVLLANKEPLVMSGHLFRAAAARSGAKILPIDSEHNAIFQCLPPDRPATAAGVRRLLLTCSGGPFRATPQAALAQVTPEQACAHPRWRMGPKISVDSATLMNKGLEVIEACQLFGVAPAQVDVVVHPQSVIHSMVEYVDGSVLAQLGNPDMRTPIAHALAWPDRIESGVTSLDLLAVGQLAFEAPDIERFPCLRLAYEAAHTGGTAPVALNAANEIAVQAFLDRRIAFTDIPRLIEAALTEAAVNAATDLDTILAEDARVRACTEERIAQRRRTAGSL